MDDEQGWNHLELGATLSDVRPFLASLFFSLVFYVISLSVLFEMAFGLRGSLRGEGSNTGNVAFWTALAVQFAITLVLSALLARRFKVSVPLTVTATSAIITVSWALLAT